MFMAGTDRSKWTTPAGNWERKPRQLDSLLGGGGQQAVFTSSGEQTPQKRHSEGVEEGRIITKSMQTDWEGAKKILARHSGQSWRSSFWLLMQASEDYYRVHRTLTRGGEREKRPAKPRSPVFSQSRN